MRPRLPYISILPLGRYHSPMLARCCHCTLDQRGVEHRLASWATSIQLPNSGTSLWMHAASSAGTSTSKGVAIESLNRWTYDGIAELQLFGLPSGLRTVAQPGPRALSVPIEPTAEITVTGRVPTTGDSETTSHFLT